MPYYGIFVSGSVDLKLKCHLFPELAQVVLRINMADKMVTLTSQMQQVLALYMSKI